MPLGLHVTGLRAQLILLVGAALLPAMVLLFWQGFERRREGESTLEAQALTLARLAAQAQERRVEGARQLLIAFAANGAVRDNNANACVSEIKVLLDQYQGLYSDIGWADRSGKIICHAIEERSSVSIADRDYFRRALLERRFVVSGMIRGKVRGTPILALAAPFTDRRGEPAGVVFVNIRLASLSESLTDVMPPQAGTILSILDRDGILIARSVDADRFLGTAAPRSQLQEMTTRGEMVTAFRGPDGTNRLFAVAVVRDVASQPAMYMVVGVPRDTLMGAIAARFRSDLVTISAFGLGALLAAWIGAEWLVRRPVRALLDVTTRLGSGHLDTRAGQISTTREFVALASGFNRMAEQLEERDVRLHQAQRLEAVGQLAGGIAHDFNNLLTVIIGYCYSVADQVDPESTAAHELGELRRAAERAASLTQQLLAFSRRQQLSPRLLHLNATISDMDSLLRRTIGEHIALEFALHPALWPVMADPAQIEQVVLNLAINSRDAMPDGGVIRISTKNSTMVSDDGARIPAVELSLSDSGVGMDPATQSRIFEPFFTTKGTAGTGLGLATVYGIVKQSSGTITCESAPGAGTRFMIVLPATTIPHTQLSRTASTSPPHHPPITVVARLDGNGISRKSWAAGTAGQR